MCVLAHKIHICCLTNLNVSTNLHTCLYDILKSISFSKILEFCVMRLFRVGTSMHNACMHFSKAVVHGSAIGTIHAYTSRHYTNTNRQCTNISSHYTDTNSHHTNRNRHYANTSRHCTNRNKHCTNTCITQTQTGITQALWGLPPSLDGLKRVAPLLSFILSSTFFRREAALIRRRMYANIDIVSWCMLYCHAKQQWWYIWQ